MKALVYHRKVNSCGGGQRVCFTIIEMLKEMNFEVTLLTDEPINWNRIETYLTSVPKINRVIYFRDNFPKFSSYLRFLSRLKINFLRRKYDLFINTMGDILPVFSDITYVHFPYIYKLVFKKKFYHYPLRSYYKTTYKTTIILLSLSVHTNYKKATALYNQFSLLH